MILESKALQKSNCGHLCQDTALQKSEINAEGRKIKFKPSVFRDSTYALTVSLPKQAGGAPLFPPSFKPSVAIGRTLMLLTFKTRDIPLNEESEILASKTLYMHRRTVSDYITELPGACCRNASQLYYGLSYSSVIRGKMIPFSQFICFKEN